MELWVRSQDKDFLVKVNGLFYWQQNLTCPDTVLHKISSGEKTLGKYESKERCLEILDEMQKLIIDSDKSLLTTSSFLDQETYDEILKEIKHNKFNVVSCENAQLFPLNTTIVYQMPEK